METVKYKIEFFDFWHTSSGLSAGTDVDMTVIKDEIGLPYIPGKTIKGLLREAVENIKQLKPELISDTFVNEVFGEKPTQKKLDKEIETFEAKCFFGDAKLSKNVYAQVEKNEILKAGFYKNIASTKIDENGQAENHSLRQMEVVIPVDLYGSIDNFSTDYKEQLKLCFDYVKRLGLNRNKGLGRCKITIVNN